MTKEQRDELRKLADAAPPAPWKVELCDDYLDGVRMPAQLDAGDLRLAYADHEVATFAAAARAAVPALLDEVERLEREVDRIRSETVTLRNGDEPPKWVEITVQAESAEERHRIAERVRRMDATAGRLELLADGLARGDLDVRRAWELVVAELRALRR
jgi:hypothetical protein